MLAGAGARKGAGVRKGVDVRAEVRAAGISVQMFRGLLSATAALLSGASLFCNFCTLIGRLCCLGLHG